MKYKAQKANLREVTLPMLQTIRNRYNVEVDYRTNRLINRSLRHDDTVSNYVAKFVKNTKSHMKAYFFNPKNLIVIFGFLATFKLTSDTNNFHKETAIWVPPTT